MAKLCLNMIVKNEVHVIRRCLDSVRPLIDTWLIVDTGSSDGTQDVIRGHLADIPGQLVERPWRNFGHNRSEALTFARDRADYTFVIDADEILALPEGFVLPSLTADAYSLLVEYGANNYRRPCVLANRLDWRFVGVLHEYLDSSSPHVIQPLNGPRVIVSAMEGGRSRGTSTADKYARDAEILKQALRDEPENRRYVFYLAQSFRDAGQLKSALKTYQKRAGMGGFEEEVWYSQFEVALLSERLRVDPVLVAHRYLEAYQARPRRAEPLVELARMHRERKEFALAHLYASRAIQIPLPDDILFLRPADYAWRGLDEYAVACYWIGDFKACASACRQLLDGTALPIAHTARVTTNLELALAKLKTP